MEITDEGCVMNERMDLFAASALVGLLMEKDGPCGEDLCRAAWNIAELMEAERSKRQDKENYKGII